MPTDKSSYDDLMKEIRTLASEGKDVAASDEFAKLKDHLNERHDSMESLAGDLKEDAEANKAFNKIQIAKEAFDIISRRDNAKDIGKSLAAQDKGLVKQKKHNQGAKTAREVMLEQNKIIIQNINTLSGQVATQGKQAVAQGKQTEEQGKKTQVVDKQLSESQKILAKETAAKSTMADGSARDKKGGMSDVQLAKQYERDQASLQRERSTLDIHGIKGVEVSDASKSLNKQKISGKEFEQEGSLGFEEGRTLRVKGKDLTRAGDYKSGTAKFKDDTGAFSETDPVKALAEDIRISQGIVGTTRNKDQFAASKGAAALNKNIGANAHDVQEAMDKNDGAKEQLAAVTMAMNKAQKGEGDRTEIYKEIEKMKLVGGEDLTKSLGLDSVMSETKQGGIANNVTSGVKGFFGVNKGTDLFSGKAVGEAFSADRFFGKAGTGGSKSLAKKTPFMGSNQFKEMAMRELETESQTKASGRALGADGLGLVDEKKKGGDKLEDWRDKWIPETNMASVAVENATEEANAVIKEVKGPEKEKVKEVKAKSGKKADTRTGTSVEGVGVKQLETLIEIRDILKETAEAGGGGGGSDSGMPMMMPPGRRGKKPKKPPKGGKKGKFKGLMKGASKFGGAAARGLGGAARFIPGIGLAVAGVTAGIGAFNEFGKTDEFGVEGEDATLGMKAASATGGALSALTFGMADADSISKGIYGKTQDQTLEELASKDPELAARIQKRVDQGENIDDVMKDEDANIKEAGVDDRGIFAKAFDISPIGMIKNAYDDATTTTDLEAGMSQAKDGGLYDENFFGDSTIDREKIEGASINQLKAIIADDDLNSEDMQFVKDTLEAKRSGQIEDIAKVGGESLENQVAGIEPSVSPTGSAIENMSRLGNEASAMASNAPIVVNNSSSNSPAPAGGDKFAIAVGSPGIRNSDSTIHRLQDRRFFG